MKKEEVKYFEWVPSQKVGKIWITMTFFPERGRASVENVLNKVFVKFQSNSLTIYKLESLK